MSTATATATAASPTMDAAAFEYIQKLVLDRSAILLAANKGYLVESRLLPLAKKLGMSTVTELAAKLSSSSFGELHEQVVDAMTTNETSFFRDIHPFEVLKKEILPPLIAARAVSQTLNIWSAACSSGQEAYTIAMTIRENFPQLAKWRINILASDLSKEMLDRVADGSYSQIEVNRGMPAVMMVKYFKQEGVRWRVKQELRDMVMTKRINLIERWPSLPKFDIIFMRNVLIYFSTEVKRQILANVRQQMASDGVLFLGGAETTMGVDTNLQRLSYGNTAVYRLQK
ncbi:MAG: CheR family methyltransferase [Planctomycetaceae bacterium]